MSVVDLYSARLWLRPFKPQDAPVFSKYRSDEQVALYQGWDAPYTLDQANTFIQVMEKAIFPTPGEWYQIAIELTETGQMIGDCAVHILDDDIPRQAEIGFTLSPEYQGKGFAFEAVTTLLNYIFGDLGLHRVAAICDEENTSCVRLLEQIGMRQEGLMKEASWFKGHWSSEYHYAILRTEWEERNAKA